MNNGVYLANNTRYNPVVIRPLVVLLNAFDVALRAFTHSLYSFLSRLSLGFDHGSPQDISEKLQSEHPYLSAFPQPLLLLLLCIHKKGQ